MRAPHRICDLVLVTESPAPATPRGANPPAPVRRAATILTAGTGREPLRTGAPAPTTAIAERRCTGRPSAR
ncbi:hypothetical protein SHL15_0160 [Streptomyces hygroscopicus subsp. limoneus]|nr:hypothetical protein SHL15_0160 [Streptomyces hygroscopicus subsp. limoneus]